MTKTYDTYKDSGIAWIGEIPSEWTLVDAKRILKNEKKLAGVEADNYERLALTLNGVIKRSKDDSEGLQPEKFESYQILGKNELVFKLIDLQNISTSRVGISPYEGLVSPAYIVVKNRKSEDNKYYYYWYMNMYFTHVFNNLGGDGVRSAINAQDLLSLKIPYISVEEQKSIASFLDKKCGEIDSLISLQEEMITELQAYKQSLITETVTKGLDPNAPMKDSGEEWIGKIPEHWKVCRFKTIAKVRANLVRPDDYLEMPQVAPDCIEKGSGKIIKYQTVKEANVISDNHLFYKGQIVYSKIRPTLNKVIIAPFDGLCCADMYPIETSENLKFFLYQMLSTIFNNQVAVVVQDRVKMPKINKEELDQILMIIPPLNDQEEIVNMLDEKTRQIDSLIDIKQSKIDELKEYKKSIIFEYVTGKKRV